jgi:integrase
MAITTRLTDAALRGLKPKDKPYKQSDERGMYAHVQPNGGKYFRLNYRHGGKSKTLALGTYPEISLALARIKREEARALITKGIDPAALKAAGKSVNNTFETIASEWLEGMSKAKNAKGWVPEHFVRQVARLEQHVYPVLGHRPVAGITPMEILDLCKSIGTKEVRGKKTLETANRVLILIKQVFVFAKIQGKVAVNPTDDLAQALPSAEEKHHPAVTKPTELADLLKSLYGYTGSPIVQAALKLAPLVFVRPGELRHAKWSDIDLDAREWRFKVSKKKKEKEANHVVPLSTQAIEILSALRPLTGKSEYVFSGARSNTRPMSDNAVLAAMRRLEIPKEVMTGHGFRATARTLLDEVLRERVDLLEHQLAHTVRDANGTAYNRTTHLPERHRMMQRWADYLDALRTGGNVLVFQKVA